MDNDFKHWPAINAAVRMQERLKKQNKKYRAALQHYAKHGLMGKIAREALEEPKTSRKRN